MKAIERAELTGNSPGTLVKFKRVGLYPAFVLRWLLSSAKLPEPVGVHYNTDLFRLQYWTTRFDSVPTIASGLVAVPRGVVPRGVVSYQHGTNPTRATTPSQPSLGEGVLGSAIFAGGGYLFLAADYIGLGTSTEVHPYMYSPSTVAAVLDLLTAARALSSRLQIQWSSKISLFGFSQGGHATAVVQRALEELGDPAFRVIASAPVAGLYDLRRISIPNVLAGESSGFALYLAYLANSYSTIYRQPLESLLTKQHAKLIPQLFDGKHTGKQIEAALSTPRALFNAEFLEAYDTDQPHWFLSALEENQAYDWKPAAPVRMYYGNSDLDVLPRDSLHAAEHMTSLGGDVQAVSVGDYDHVQSVYHAIPKVRTWLDTFHP
jgi:pimeloyl-ACP methyl ester carboxylesterase